MFFYTIFSMEKIPILFENDEIFVINKPAGLSVQGGVGVTHALDESFSQQVGYKIHLVHRLDKETCGLMVVAKNAAAAKKWIELIASKLVHKEYTAICFGEPVISGKKQKNGVISANVIKKNGKNEREQAAVTQFFVEHVWHTEFFTFSKIHLKLGTGRMHQIRIHLASVSAPICGDDKHGNFKLNKLAKKQLKIKNLLLCSQKLTIPTNDGKTRTFEIDVPDYFRLPIS